MKSMTDDELTITVLRCELEQAFARIAELEKKCYVFCKYCGARLKRDAVGHYCPTHNCQWSQGVSNCVSKEDTKP